MKCTICNKEVVLSPSAKERAAKYGGKPSDYTALFTTHSECELKKREADTLALMKKLKAQGLTVTGRAVAYIPEMQSFPPRKELK